MEKMTISQYAKLVGVEKDTVHKRLKRDGKLKWVKKIEKSIGTYNPTIILSVSKPDNKLK